MHDDVGPLSPSEALELTRSGGTILCLGVPTGLEFGIDLRSYDVGPRFQGIKMVPTAGLHLVTCGSEIERSGVFVRVHASDTCAMEWNAQDETLQFTTPGHAAQLAASVQRMEYDGTLGPYPLATESQWHELSAYVNEGVLRRAGIPPGTFVVPGGIDDDEHAGSSDSQPPLQPFHGNLPRVAAFVGLDPRRSARVVGLAGAALSQFHLDRSEWLEELLNTQYADGDGDAAAECALLGEMQLAFLLFLRLSSLRALEQWKALIHLLCHCELALSRRPTLFTRAVCEPHAERQMHMHMPGT